MIFSKLQNEFIEKFEKWVKEEYLLFENNNRLYCNYSRKENESFYYIFLDTENFVSNFYNFSFESLEYFSSLYKQGFSFESLVHDRISNMRKFEDLYSMIERRSLIIRISKKYKNLEFYTKHDFLSYVKTSDRRKKNYRNLNTYFLKKYTQKKIKISSNNQVTVYNQFNQPKYISHKTIQYYNEKIQGFSEFPIKEFLEFLLMGHLGINKVLTYGEYFLRVPNKFAKNTNGEQDIINKINPVFAEPYIYKILSEQRRFDFIFLISRIFNEKSSKEFRDFYLERIALNNGQIFNDTLYNREVQIIVLFLLYKNNFIVFNGHETEDIRLYERQIKDVILYVNLVLTYVREDLIFQIETKLNNQFLLFKAIQLITKKRLCVFKNEFIKYKFIKKHQTKIENCLNKDGVKITFLKSTNQLLKMFNEYTFLFAPNIKSVFLEFEVPDEKIIFIISLIGNNKLAKFCLHPSTDKKTKNKRISNIINDFIKELSIITEQQEIKSRSKYFNKEIPTDLIKSTQIELVDGQNLDVFEDDNDLPF